MTKTKTKRNRIVLAAAILAVAGLGVWYMMSVKSSSKKATTASSKTEKTQQETDDLNKNDPTTNKKVASTAPASTTNQNLAITVSRPVNNDTLPLSEGIEIRSVISGATSGSCSVTATGPGGKTASKNGTIMAQSSYGSCSINIPSSDVVAGDWQVAMTATSGSSIGKANVKVTLQ